jgi:hypothetical protein
MVAAPLAGLAWLAQQQVQRDGAVEDLDVGGKQGRAQRAMDFRAGRVA